MWGEQGPQVEGTVPGWEEEPVALEPVAVVALEPVEVVEPAELELQEPEEPAAEGVLSLVWHQVERRWVALLALPSPG